MAFLKVLDGAIVLIGGDFGWCNTYTVGSLIFHAVKICFLCNECKVEQSSQFKCFVHSS